ncbi:MAG: SpoIIE family protein phosphatase [Verrucomicrobiales bacterium]
MSEQIIKVLLVEAVPKYARVAREMLESARENSFHIFWADSIASALTALEKEPFEVVLFDLAMGDDPAAALKALRAIDERVPEIPIIVLSEQHDADISIQAMHEGAQDTLVKNEITAQLLVRSVRYAIERKRVESALHRAEEKYRSIYENTVEGIFQTTADGHYISANAALARIYGYDTPQELITSLTDISQELYVEHGRRAEFVLLMEEHDVVTAFESRIFRKDRGIIWISENVRAVRDRNGKLLYYEGTVEDITERKNSEERLRNSETLYHSLVETLPQNIFRKNLAEQFTFANQRFCQTLGRPLNEILGKTDFDFFPAALAAKYQKDDQVILETGKSFETVEENVPHEGEKLYVNVVKTPLYDAQGNIIGLQGIFWDITEKKRAEERVRKATLELARHREELRLKNEQMEDDLKMAREIQQAILPQQYPCFPKTASAETTRLKFSHRYIPTGAVGGDFFNIIPVSDTKAGVFICDVMGHGVRSALITAILRALVEELTRLATSPGELLGQINRDLRAILKSSGTPLFTTAFYMVIDLEENEICYSNAGHPKPMMVNKATGTVQQIGSGGGRSQPALGLMDEVIFPTSMAKFGPEDLFVLFTDGIYDVEKEGDLLSPEWLACELKKKRHMPTSRMFDEILAELKQLSEGEELADDVCIVGIELNS